MIGDVFAVGTFTWLAPVANFGVDVGAIDRVDLSLGWGLLEATAVVSM